MSDSTTCYRWGIVLDGKGGGQDLTWEQAQAWTPEAGPLWVHLERTVDEETKAWLARQGLEGADRTALLAAGTRPRTLAATRGLIVILRGVNLNEGATPDDMISLRVSIDPTRLISVREEKLRATGDALVLLHEGQGPKTSVELLIRLITIMGGRIQAVLEDLSGRADVLEASVGEINPQQARADLTELRRQVIALRRYLAPQRASLANLALEPAEWIDAMSRAIFRELADRATRYVEELEELRERAAVIHDEIANRVAEQVNQRMFFLTLVAAVFLPLSFLTGLLGINVGGIPGATDETAFGTVFVLLLLVAAAIGFTFRRVRWI